jgi:hypothetical protein
MVKQYFKDDKTFRRLYFILSIWFILTCLFLTSPVNSFSITTDETTETSIIWNLSALPVGVNISQISFDGIIITGYVSNPKQIVQNNLYSGETHLISIIDNTGNISEAQAKTISKPQSESEKTFSVINLWILVLLALVFLCASVFTGIHLIAYISCLLTFLGILTSINNNFITGCIFIIMFCASALIAYDW